MSLNRLANRLIDWKPSKGSNQTYDRPHVRLVWPKWCWRSSIVFVCFLNSSVCYIVVCVCPKILKNSFIYYNFIFHPTRVGLMLLSTLRLCDSWNWQVNWQSSVVQRVPHKWRQGLELSLQQQAIQNKRGFDSRNCYNQYIPPWKVQTYNEGTSEPKLQPRWSDLWSRFSPITVLPPLEWANFQWGNSVGVFYIRTQHSLCIQNLWASMGRPLCWYQRRCS